MKKIVLALFMIAAGSFTAKDISMAEVPATSPAVASSVENTPNLWTVETVPNTRLTDARVYVSDPNNLLDEASKTEINSILGQVETASSAEIFVVALKSVGEIYIKDFATSLFNKWGIGKKSNDNGMLILMVEDQSKVSFETGYGMEGVFPDAICMRIISKNIIPSMKEGNYGLGLLNGVKEVKTIIDNPSVANEIRQDIEAEKADNRVASIQKIKDIAFIYLGLSVLVLILSIIGINKKKPLAPYEAYKQLNSFRAGYNILTVLFPLTMVFFQLWYKLKLNKLRKMPRACPVCAKPMHRMKESQEDAYLSTGQQSEELVGSVDYDAWVCMDCGNREIISYGKEFTKYQVCPKCGYKTYALAKNRILLSPTPISNGQGEKIYSCANCQHEVRKSYIIPMIILASVGRGKGGGFGGFGGGGGSFGGGMSGGGGATGGW